MYYRYIGNNGVGYHSNWFGASNGEIFCRSTMKVVALLQDAVLRRTNEL